MPEEFAVTPHFLLREFGCPAGYGLPAAPYPREWVADRLRPLCQVLEAVRAELGGVPVRVLSGYRSQAYNDALRADSPGVAARSLHIQGLAADISAQGVPPAQVHAAVLALWHGRTGAPRPGVAAPRIGGLGLYRGWVHIDIRPGVRLVRWTGL